jgi:hypothetical protein
MLCVVSMVTTIVVGANLGVHDKFQFTWKINYEHTHTSHFSLTHSDDSNLRSCIHRLKILPPFFSMILHGIIK